MAKWNNSDKIAVFGTAVAIAFGVVTMPFGHTDVPDAAIVIEESSHPDPGVRIEKIRFRNTSYGAPLEDFEARWDIDCRLIISYSVDGNTPGAQLNCDSQKSEAVLSVAGILPPFGWIGTTFTAQQSALFPVPKVKAYRSDLLPGGISKVPVWILQADAYNELVQMENRRLAIRIALTVFFVGIALSLLKVFFS